MNSLIKTTTFTTSLGSIIAATTGKGICLLDFTDQQRTEKQIVKIKRLLKTELQPGTHKQLDTLQQQITEYFDGKRKTFSVPLDIPGTDFQIKVWNELQSIPYGLTRSYSDQAVAIGNPKAVRAVAKANGDNFVSIIIPCHRVIGKNGKLVGYGGGLWRKQKLLDLEKNYL